MSWHCSRALVEEFSAATCLDGAASAPSNTTPTPAAFYWPDKTTEHSRLSRFGMTSEPLTADRGEAVLMSYLAASPVRTSAVLGRRKGLQESSQASGWKCPESFAKWDRDSSSWRTRQTCVIEGLETFSETWPEWGLMLDGECLAGPNVARLRPGRASGLLPTLTASDATGARNGTCSTRDISAGLTLTDWLWLNVGRGKVHPESAEWTMLWPSQWTALEPLGTGRFQLWQLQHGACLEANDAPL
jgi:hypothetical protein